MDKEDHIKELLKEYDLAKANLPVLTYEQRQTAVEIIRQEYTEKIMVLIEPEVSLTPFQKYQQERANKL